MLRGSCLCGGVQYVIDGPLSGVLNCRCTMCRKAHSAAFRTRASVKTADFRWVESEDLVTFYDDITDGLPQFDELPEKTPWACLSWPLR